MRRRRPLSKHVRLPALSQAPARPPAYRAPARPPAYRALRAAARRRFCCCALLLRGDATARCYCADAAPPPLAAGAGEDEGRCWVQNF